MVLGALVDIVDELPGDVPTRCTYDVVSSSAVPAANCELVCIDSWERVSSVLPLGDDIFTHSTASVQQNFFSTEELELVFNVVLLS